MDLYEFVHVIAERTGLKLAQSDKERLVGTLRTAGFGEHLSTKRDKEQAMAVVTRSLSKAAAKLRTAAASTDRDAAAKKQGAELFQAIKQLNAEHRCGKCKNPTEIVKLANNEEANYCTSCRVTLWKD